ncbi:MAG TPA: hemerythrin domain-containing protein [Burkholderiaceae bacterium]|nr:hemerythrin domain-containing protein [Burkholderiaceae bacterium]
MSGIMDLWHAEHAKFGRLLGVLEAEIARFHEGEVPNYETIGDIVDYLREYADAFHHPREDVAFDRLMIKDGAAGELVGRLRQEHRVIGEAGRALSEQLAELAAGAVVPRSRIEAAAATYLTYYREHLQREERVAMPLIAARFGDDDWCDVEAALTRGADPLFGDGVDARFHSLRKRLAHDLQAGSGS